MISHDMKQFESQAEELDFQSLDKLTPAPKPSLGYHEPDEVIRHIQASEEIVKINLEDLAVNGEVKAEPMEEYLKNPANGSSDLKNVLVTPFHYYASKNQLYEKTPRDYFNLGTFAHMAFLEPELFERVIVEPRASLSSHDGCDTLIKFYEDQIIKALEARLIKVADYKLFQKPDLGKIDSKKSYIEVLKSFCPFQSVSEHHKNLIDYISRQYYRYGDGIIPRLLKGAVKEVSFYAEDPETGLPVKVRPDGFQIAENIGVDAVISFKTTQAGDLRKFFYDTAAYQYELSEGMYQEVISHVTGREVKTTIMVMLQTVEPYMCAVLWWDAEDLENGKYKYRHAMSTIKDCYDSGKFPGFDAMAEVGHMGIVKMKQPNWAMKELLPVEIQ